MYIKCRLLLWGSAALLALAHPALAQKDDGMTMLSRTGAFIEQVPTPEQVLGFAPGSRPATYHEMAMYLQVLADASERVQLRDYGRSSGGQRLLALTVSSPENLARLDTIRVDLHRLGDGTLAADAANDLIERLPATAWMGYGIHGDEISGPDAALELAYRLAASRSDTTVAILRDLVIHIDPVVNPDGRDRSVGHIRAFARRTASEDPKDLSHASAWPEGRGNHYLVDLNRDALHTVQQEARARVAAILDASPQLLVDAHEMGADDTFLFAMPAEPRNPLLPAGVHVSWDEFASDHAAAFDGDGTSFYTRSWNEVFYPGYFDIWPAYQGAVPIIYEQAATAGTTLRLPNGRRRGYAEAVEHQLRSSLANLETAARNRAALLTRWAQARRNALQSESSKARAWVVLPTDSYKLTQAARTLLAQGLIVERLQRPAQAGNLHSLWNSQSRSMELPAGTLLIRAAQPLGRLAHNLLDLHVPMPADFLREERRRLDVGGRSVLYDITAWSLPHAFAADVLWTDRVPTGQWEQISKPEAAVEAQPALTEARYGYLYRDPSLFVTGRLLQQGVKVRVAREALVLDGRDYEAGTMLIRNDDQAASVFESIRQAQASGEAQFVPVNSARIRQGPDLGDQTFHLLSAPRIAVVAGPGFEDTSVGAVMHLFDVTIGIHFTLFDFDQVDSVTLRDYDVLILPDVVDESKFAAGLKAGSLEGLQRWVERGGTLIALRSASSGLAATGFTAAKLRRSVTEQYPPLMLGRPAAAVVAQDFLRAAGASGLDRASSDKEYPPTLPVIGAAARAFLKDDQAAASFQFPATAPSLAQWLERLSAAESLKARAPELLRSYLPHGAYLKAELNSEHWLATAVPSPLPSLFREDDTLIADAGCETVGRYGEPLELALSGLVWPEAVGYIAGTAHLVRERRGDGQVILFAGDPLFRGYSLGTQRLFLNAVLLGPAFAAAD